MLKLRFGRRNNRNGPRGRSGKIPDDYYYSYTDGNFHLKESKDPPIEYVYSPDLGVWKNPNEEAKSNPKLPDVADYYFDKEVHTFPYGIRCSYLMLNPLTKKLFL